MQNNANNPTGRKAYVITGSTSGIGLSSSLLLASKVLSARPPKRLASGAAATFPRRRVRAVSGSLVAQRCRARMPMPRRSSASSPLPSSSRPAFITTIRAIRCSAPSSYAIPSLRLASSPRRALYWKRFQI